jgi:hypothetical protein
MSERQNAQCRRRLRKCSDFADPIRADKQTRGEDAQGPNREAVNAPDPTKTGNAAEAKYPVEAPRHKQEGQIADEDAAAVAENSGGCLSLAHRVTLGSALLLRLSGEADIERTSDFG